MTVREADGSAKPLRIEQADITVKILGDVAETALELTFRNDGPRAVEGEFVLPLPEGATVSGYALEVNGAMRAAVAVEKERARTAYETVKRRMIDPGIVEREAGNIYRTKVYPVPANGTKRLRISYIEVLREGRKKLLYSLPLDFPAPLTSFSCHLHGDNLRVTDGAGLEFADDGSGGLRAEMQSFKPTGTLRVTLKKPGDELMILDDGPKPAFMLSTRSPELAARAMPAPQTVMLVWDASGSGRDRDHEREFALLEAWFAKLGKAHVKLYTLRDRMEDAGGFEIRDGAWPDLRQALENMDYDGATDFSQIKVGTGQADLMLLVSDGAATLGSAPPKVDIPWFFIHPENIPTGKPLGRAAIASGGDEITLSKDVAVSGLAKLTHLTPRLISVTGADLADVLIETSSGQRLRLLGSLRESRAGTLELRYGYGREVTTTRTLAYQPGGNPDGIVRRLHAQRVLADLERQIPPDRKTIIKHCKLHGLVSDFTSLIVLERLEDYAEHGIRPPEKELQSQYDKLVVKFDARKSESLGGLARAWGEKLAWYGKRFPGYEARILPRLRQLGIWKQAVEMQFTPDQRDAQAFGVVAGWFDKATQLIDDIPELRTTEEYANWRQEIDALHQQGPELAATPLHAPPAGQALAVSVRGLVSKSGVITSERPMTLREAIGMAGGSHPMDKLDNVALYRNGGKVVYNTLSERFQDIPLFPADMVVVGQKDISYDGNMDPFSAPSPPSDPRKEAPVREEADVWTTQPAVSGGGGGSGARPSDGSGGIRIVPLEADSLDLPESAAFENELVAGKTPEAVYRKHRGDKVRPQRFYIEAARILFSRKQDALAQRVLSNLVETRPGDVSALRSYAFWLAEFGQTEAAEGVLEGISGDARTGLLVDMDLASLRASRGSAEVAYGNWYNAMEDVGDAAAGNLAAVALTEFNGLRHKVRHGAGAGPLVWHGTKYDIHLPADIRIVLTSADDTDSLRFEAIEPGGVPCSTTVSPSPIGGRVIGSYGVREYMIRRAVPGAYQINFGMDHPATVRVVIHTNWGRPDETTRVVTLLPESDKLRRIAELEFEFQATE